MTKKNVNFNKNTQDLKVLDDIEQVINTLEQNKNVIKKNFGYDSKILTYTELGDKKRKTPISLIFTSDWHLGSKYCDYKQWLADLKYLLKFDPKDVRLILLGDLIDNIYPGFKDAESVFGLLSVFEQKKLLFKVIDLIRPYLEISCWGNHDIEWDEKKIGYSDVADKLMNSSIYFSGSGMVDYYVGKQKYKIYMSHKMRGKSIYHSLQDNISGWVKTHADIVVTSHIHDFAFMTDNRGVNEDGSPKPRYLIKLGSYKNENDIYTIRHFGQVAYRGIPVLKLYPDVYKVEFSSNFYV